MLWSKVNAPAPEFADEPREAARDVVVGRRSDGWRNDMPAAAAAATRHGATPSPLRPLPQGSDVWHLAGSRPFIPADVRTDFFPRDPVRGAPAPVGATARPGAAASRDPLATAAARPATAAPQPLGGWPARLADLWARLRHEHRVSRTVSFLEECDDRMLRDIGIHHRSQIEHFVRFGRHFAGTP